MKCDPVWGRELPALQELTATMKTKQLYLEKEIGYFMLTNGHFLGFMVRKIMGHV